MKIMQVIPAFRLAGAEVMCENLCIALKNAGESVIAVSLYSEKTAAGAYTEYQKNGSARTAVYFYSRYRSRI